jgi:transcriptional regulator with XRE-family HTH domain
VNIGIRIRSIRTQQGRMLDHVAQACGCSKSLISKIETGKVVPALATLSKIATALGVRISAILEDGEDTGPALTANLIDHSDAFVATAKGYTIYVAPPHFLSDGGPPPSRRGRCNCLMYALKRNLNLVSDTAHYGT